MDDHVGRQASVRVWICNRCGVSGWIEPTWNGSLSNLEYVSHVDHMYKSPECQNDQPYVIHGFDNYFYTVDLGEENG